MKPSLVPGKVYLVYGKKGAGKSVYLASCAFYALKAGRTVYANTEIVGCYSLPTEYWLFTYPKGSVIIIDEVALIHRNRDFKSFPKECSGWYKMIRKLDITVILSSQIDDVDKSLRSSADVVYRFTSKYGPFSFADRWINTLVVQPSVNADGKATGAAEIAMGLSKPAGFFKSFFFQYRPRYYHLFDTAQLFVKLAPVDNAKLTYYQESNPQ